MGKDAFPRVANIIFFTDKVVKKILRGGQIFFQIFILLLERATHQNPAGPPPYLPGGTIRIPYRHGRAIRILIATVEKTLPFSSMRDIGKPLFYHGSKKKDINDV